MKELPITRKKYLKMMFGVLVDFLLVSSYIFHAMLLVGNSIEYPNKFWHMVWWLLVLLKIIEWLRYYIKYNVKNLT